ncbi:uncharacterized protein LOC122128506 [Clupea harengus]|uniref:Uncharacterized protein LOC122128506 n=1 Tax=Clupea harengus TaxID=7950 RepID=A0A8M1K975_CLUHA|nr:uncharacterized protein LOC122128506 [Clupea harengus]
MNGLYEKCQGIVTKAHTKCVLATQTSIIQHSSQENTTVEADLSDPAGTLQTKSFSRISAIRLLSQHLPKEDGFPQKPGSSQGFF